MHKLPRTNNHNIHESQQGISGRHEQHPETKPSSPPVIDPFAPGFVGGRRTPEYHIETVPCTRDIRQEEINRFRANPARLVGNKFAPHSSEDVWEVTEVRFSKGKGWSSLVQFEGSEEQHKMDLTDFLGMLGSGSVQYVEQE